MINKKRLVNLTRQLIRINSENPPGNEAAIGRFVKVYLERLGLRPKVYEFARHRPNVVAVLEGALKKHSLLITPHLDTVPAGRSWKTDPFSAQIKNNKIYGLGATDCKGNLASALEAINSLLEDGIKLGYNLVFAATADEEAGSGLGLIPLLNRGILKPSAAVVLDSNDFDIIVTQKGLIHFKVSLEGKRAHGAYPWRGVNAIDIALDALRELKGHRFTSVKNNYLRPPTLNIGTIKGGDKVNVVADWCEFELDLRFLPGMRPGDILKEIKRLINRHAKNFKIEIEGIQKPYVISRNHYLVSGLTGAIRKVNARPAILGSEGATVITFFQDKGIPAVATGFGSGGCAHAAGEFAKIDNLYKGSHALEVFLKEYSYGRN